MNPEANSDPFPLHMSQFNRLQAPMLETIALTCAKLGEVIVIQDEPETRIYKDYKPLIHVTLTSLIMQTNEQSHEEEELCGTTLPSEAIFFSPIWQVKRNG